MIYFTMKSDQNRFWAFQLISSSIEQKKKKQQLSSLQVSTALALRRLKEVSTFKVYCAVAVVIDFFDHGVELSPIHVLPH